MVRMQQVIDALIAKDYDMQLYMHRVEGVDNVYDTSIHLAMNGYDTSESRHILLDIPLEKVEELLNAQVFNSLLHI